MLPSPGTVKFPEDPLTALVKIFPPVPMLTFQLSLFGSAGHSAPQTLISATCACRLLLPRLGPIHCSWWFILARGHLQDVPAPRTRILTSFLPLWFCFCSVGQFACQYNNKHCSKLCLLWNPTGANQGQILLHSTRLNPLQKTYRGACQEPRAKQRKLAKVVYDDLYAEDEVRIQQGTCT